MDSTHKGNQAEKTRRRRQILTNFASIGSRVISARMKCWEGLDEQKQGDRLTRGRETKGSKKEGAAETGGGGGGETHIVTGEVIRQEAIRCELTRSTNK